MVRWCLVAEIAGFSELVLGQDDGFVDVVALAFVTDDRVDEHADQRLLDGEFSVGLEPCALHQPLVAGVGDVSGLMRDDSLPSFFFELLPQCQRGNEVRIVRGIDLGPDLPG